MEREFSFSRGRILIDDFRSSLVAYFVIFNASGFTPADVSRAQKAQIGSNPIYYFLPDSPDFINNAGVVIQAQQQVNAWGQAQSITYLSIFIIQCFNIYACKAKFLPPFGRQIISNYYNLRSSLSSIEFAKIETDFFFSRYFRRSSPRHVHHLHSTTSRRIRRILHYFTTLLAHSNRIWLCRFSLY